jgi:hypothetical protein
VLYSLDKPLKLFIARPEVDPSAHNPFELTLKPCSAATSAIDFRSEKTAGDFRPGLPAVTRLEAGFALRGMPASGRRFIVALAIVSPSSGSHAVPGELVGPRAAPA